MTRHVTLLYLQVTAVTYLLNLNVANEYPPIAHLLAECSPLIHERPQSKTSHTNKVSAQIPAKSTVHVTMRSVL